MKSIESRAFETCINRRSLFLATVVVVAAAFSAGCGPRINSDYFAPADISVGNSLELVLTAGTGPQDSQLVAIEMLASEIDADGFFDLEDGTRSARILTANGNATLDVDDSLLAELFGETSLFIRMDIQQWDVDTEIVTREVIEMVDDYEEVYEEEVELTTASVVLQVTLIDDVRRVLSLEASYSGDAEGEASEYSEEEVQEEAMRSALADLLFDITPVLKEFTVLLDDGDPGQSDLIEGALAGEIEESIAKAQAIVDDSPENATAVYNFAGLLDVNNEFERAVEQYGRAISLGEKDFYATYLDACEQRLSDQRSLEQ